MPRHDPSDLFAADAFAMDAGSLLIRAVTAGENGRASDQAALVERAVAQLANAIARLNPATVGRLAA